MQLADDITIRCRTFFVLPSQDWGACDKRQSAIDLGRIGLTDAESEVCCFLELSERMNSRVFLERLDCLLTGGALLALGRSLSAVFFLRRALWRCRRALQLRLSPSKDVTSWKRPHCWQKRWRFPSLMMLLTCCTRPESTSVHQCQAIAVWAHQKTCMPDFP